MSGPMPGVIWNQELVSIVMQDADCDRCGKHADELHAFKLSNSITYYKRVIEKPWLCLKCFRIEKNKWWAAL